MRLASMRSRFAFVCGAVALAGSVSISSPGATAARAAGTVQIVTLSARADLVSGGAALVEVILPQGVNPSDARVDVDGRDVTSAFASGRLPGLLTGIPATNMT